MGGSEKEGLYWSSSRIWWGLREGDAEAQRLAVERVASHLGVEVEQGTMGVVEEELFGVGRTFRKGQIGAGGRSSQGARAGDQGDRGLLVELGYEADPEW